MEQYVLSNEEKRSLKEHAKEFQKWMETEIGQRQIQVHREHENYFKQKLGPENLSKVTKEEITEIYKQFWASKFWSNKEWKINKIIDENGLDNIKKEMHLLLYGNELFEKRYDSFRKEIKGFGISAISEILNMVFPEKFCLWNNVTKTVLLFLKLKNNLSESVFKYNNISGEEYAQCIKQISTIKKELSDYGINDFVDLDMFFWFIHENVIPKDWKQDSQLDYYNGEQNTVQEKKDIFNLEKLILEYDKNKDIVRKRKITEEESMQFRSEFISDFPSDKILNLKIDSYVQGKKLGDTNETNKKTFCYRLEWGLPGFGSLGGVNAIKFGIYYSPKNEKYVYNEKKFISVEEAYQKILEQIDILLKSGRQFTQDNDWKKLSDSFESVNDIKSIVKSKILSVYFPDKIVLINSNNGVRQILKLLFKIPDEEIQEEFMLNKKKLWEIKQSHLIMKNWSNFEYSYFVWYVWKKYFDSSNNLLPVDKRLDDNTNQLKTGFWIVRAGDTGQEEKVALDNNLITIHYGLHDFSSFKSKDEIINFFMKNPENDNGDINKRLQASQYVEQIWSFLKEIKKSDIVLLPLKSRQSEWISLGIVKGDYEYRNMSETVKSTRRVEWLNKEIPKKEFDETILRFLRLPRTVFRIKSFHAIQNIVDIMKKYQILPSYLEKELIKHRGLEIQLEENQDIELLQKQQYIISIGELSNQTYLSLERLKEIEYLLNEKKQMIFYGPPGTSKTFVAKKFAHYFTQNPEFVEIIQFHPSYSYEDFIEGIKPKLSEEGEATGFVKQSGVFKNIVDKCIKNSDKKFILIIDEINRGNISKIFGELIYLLEYRNEKIHLTYSPLEEFYIPKNLYIIGTMNSADRSIAFVDYALRRRFYFIEFYPNEDILKKWFITNNIKEFYQNNVLAFLKEINIEISKKLGKEYQIGYSYFMNNLDYQKVKRTIDYAIIPLIEQYFFGKKDNIDIIRNICNTYLIRLQDFEERKEQPFLDSLESFSS